MQLYAFTHRLVTRSICGLAYPIRPASSDRTYVEYPKIGKSSSSTFSSLQKGQNPTSPWGGFTTSVRVASKLDKSTDSWKVQLSSLTAMLSFF